MTAQASALAAGRLSLPLNDERGRTATASIRNGLVDWIEQSGCRWCLTLNPNRSHALGTELGIVRQAFADADQLLLGQRFNRVDARKRLLAFVMPEHVKSNLHFHLAVRAGLPGDDAEERQRIETLADCWRARVPSGSFEIERTTNAHGWARYITKELWRSDAEFVASSMWWPERQRRHVLERSWRDPMDPPSGVK
jgi:hypothetical protein